MHQQLGDLTPVRAVLALCGLELHGAHDAALTLRDEQDHSVSRDSRPPVARHIRRQGRVKAERRTLSDAGDQHLRQVVKLFSGKPVYATD
jgi:hypothetical protein